MATRAPSRVEKRADTTGPAVLALWLAFVALLISFVAGHVVGALIAAFEATRVVTYFFLLEFAVALLFAPIFAVFPIYYYATRRVGTKLGRVLLNAVLVLAPYILVDGLALCLLGLSLTSLLAGVNSAFYYATGANLTDLISSASTLALGTMAVLYMLLQPSISISVACLKETSARAFYKNLLEFSKRTWHRSLLASVAGVVLASAAAAGLYYLLSPTPLSSVKMVAYEPSDRQLAEFFNDLTFNPVEAASAVLWLVVYSHSSLELFTRRNPEPTHLCQA